MSGRPPAPARSACAIALACATALGCNQILGIEPPTDRNGGAGGTTGAAGTIGPGAAGTTGSAGVTGAAGSATGAAGATGSGGTTGVAGRGGTTGAGGAMGSGGRGGTGGATGTGGTGGVVVPCSARQAVDAIGIYVDSFGGDTGTCGSRAVPCKTIQTGIARALAVGRSAVYVNTGTYNETFGVPAGIRVEGGWNVVGSDWTPNCSATASDMVIVQQPASISSPVVTQASGQGGLAYLTIKTKATAMTGETLYGIYVSGAGATLDIDQVKVVAAAGGDGAGVAKGANGPSATAGGCDPGSNATAGTDGMLGGGASAGAFTMSGYVPSDGQTGMNGGTGQNGPVRGTAPTCISYSGITGSLGCFDSCSGSNGNCSSPGLDSCGTDGRGGCPGMGGRGGPGGKGGGSSVALFVWAGTVNVVGGSLTAAAGGRGSAGGLGGDAGPGGAGTPGAPGRSCYYNYCQSMGSACVGNPPSGMAVGGQPGVGGTGGPGGKGGQGGGGAGGFSYAVYKGGGAAVTVSASTTLMVGAAGTSAGNGAAGVAKAIGP